MKRTPVVVGVFVLAALIAYGAWLGIVVSRQQTQLDSIEARLTQSPVAVLSPSPVARPIPTPSPSSSPAFAQLQRVTDNFGHTWIYKLYLLRGAQWVAASGAPSGTMAAGAKGAILIGDGSAKLGSPGWIKYSVDAGAHWQQATGLPYDQSIEAIAGQPTSSIFCAYCYRGDVYTSTDGGRAWSLYTRALRTTSG